mmetsp:Transcript_10416/g.23370  ORF Transcript_10416/g.23370 Transcript_10416/m.23370 type:complete len:242 (+) Transcript_10416:312-1037(+)
MRMTSSQKLHATNLLDGVLQQSASSTMDSGPFHHFDCHVRANDLPHNRCGRTTGRHARRSCGIVGGCTEVPPQDEAGPNTAVDGILKLSLRPVGNVLQLFPSLWRWRLYRIPFPAPGPSLGSSSTSCAAASTTSAALRRSTGTTSAGLQILPMNHPLQHLPPTGRRMDHQGVDPHSTSDERGWEVQRSDCRAGLGHLVEGVARVRGGHVHLRFLHLHYFTPTLLLASRQLKRWSVGLGSGT